MFQMTFARNRFGKADKFYVQQNRNAAASVITCKKKKKSRNTQTT